MKFRLAYLFLLFFAFSCGRGNPALRSAERVIEDHPDSALYILDGISRVDLASEREKAEYDFLSAEAFYRTYFFLDDASEAALERACLYFEENGPAVERMRAWELMGTIQTAVGRYGNGMVSFRKAGAVARDIERSRSRLGMLALLVAGVLATLVLYFWARKIQTERLLAEKQAENERYLSAAEDLQSKLSALKADRPRMGGIDTLDRLCEQYYVFEGTSNLQPRILGEVKAIVEGLRSDTKVQKNLEQALDERAGGVFALCRRDGLLSRFYGSSIGCWRRIGRGLRGHIARKIPRGKQSGAMCRLRTRHVRLQPSPDFVNRIFAHEQLRYG